MIALIIFDQRPPTRRSLERALRISNDPLVVLQIRSQLIPAQTKVRANAGIVGDSNSIGNEKLIYGLHTGGSLIATVIAMAKTGQYRGDSTARKV